MVLEAAFAPAGTDDIVESRAAHHVSWYRKEPVIFTGWQPGGLFVERPDGGELRHLRQDDGSRTAVTAHERPGGRLGSSLVARREFDRIPAERRGREVQRRVDSPVGRARAHAVRRAHPEWRFSAGAVP